MREEKVHFAVSREYYRSLPSWKLAKKNALLLRVNIVVWGFHKGLQGPIWPIHGPMPRVRWVERRKSSPKASAVPLPCSTFSLVFMGGGRAAAPIGDKVL